MFCLICFLFLSPFCDYSFQFSDGSRGQFLGMASKPTSLLYLCRFTPGGQTELCSLACYVQDIQQQC